MRFAYITSVLNEHESIEKYIHDFINFHPEACLILVDGGSVDGTIDIIKKCMSDSVKLLLLPKSSIYEALNYGITYAAKNFDYIGFLGVGDYVLNFDYLSKEVKGGLFKIIYPDLMIGGKIYRSMPVSSSTKFGILPFPHIGTLYSSGLFHTYGGFDTKYKIAADLDWVIRVCGNYRLDNINFFKYAPDSIVYMLPGGVSNSVKHSKQLIFELLSIYIRNFRHLSIRRLAIVLYKTIN